MHLFFNKTIIIIAVGLIISLQACEKDEPEPVYENGILRGTIIDYTSGAPAKDVKVLASGPYGSKKAITNSQGAYEINKLGNGTYEVEFLKEGWGAQKHYSVQIYGNDTVTINERMLKYPEFQMPEINTQEQYVEDLTIRLKTNLSSDITEIPSVRAFISKSSNVSCFLYEQSIMGFFFTTDTEKNIFYDFYFSPQFNLIKHGEKAYMIIYLCSINDNGYVNPYNSQLVYPTVNPDVHSRIIEFTIP